MPCHAAHVVEKLVPLGKCNNTQQNDFASGSTLIAWFHRHGEVCKFSSRSFQFSHMGAKTLLHTKRKSTSVLGTPFFAIMQRLEVLIVY